MTQEKTPMADQQNNDIQEGAIKDPKEWKSGDDPATPSQLSYLNTLATQAGEDLENGDLTKAEASVVIDRLREEAGMED
jgi:hypothetical protein